MSEQPSPDDLAEPMFVRNVRRLAQGEHLYHPAESLRPFVAEFDRRGQELDRIRRVRCLGHVYSGLQPPEQCGDYAGHEGKCQP
jgi:hypothetical protein